MFNVSSLAGLLGAELASLYCASKFVALEGFSECLAKEVAPFGLFVAIVEPGSFRTDFLTPESMRFDGNPVPDYDERRGRLMASFEQRNGQQPGDPARLAGMGIELEKWREFSVSTDRASRPWSSRYQCVLVRSACRSDIFGRVSCAHARNHLMNSSLRKRSPLCGVRRPFAR